MRENRITLTLLFWLFVYYCFARFLPASTFPLLGGCCRKFRGFVCKHIFKKSGKNTNIERMTFFGAGNDIEIGDNSGIGINCVIPNGTKIGNDVMMAPNCYILPYNHRFDRIDIPMREQGTIEKKNVIIDDDVWIGRDVTMTPGRHISKGTIVGACCVLTKDFPAYSVVGGNPSRLLKSRILQEE